MKDCTPTADLLMALLDSEYRHLRDIVPDKSRVRFWIKPAQQLCRQGLAEARLIHMASGLSYRLTAQGGVTRMGGDSLPGSGGEAPSTRSRSDAPNSPTPNPSNQRTHTVMNTDVTDAGERVDPDNREPIEPRHIAFAQALVALAREHGFRSLTADYYGGGLGDDMRWTKVHMAWAEGRHGAASQITLRAEAHHNVRESSRG